MEMKGLGRPAYILCISLLWGFLYIEKWFDKKKSSMMEHAALPYDLVIEGRRFCSAIACRILILGRFYDREWR